MKCVSNRCELLVQFSKLCQYLRSPVYHVWILFLCCGIQAGDKPKCFLVFHFIADGRCNGLRWSLSVCYSKEGGLCVLSAFEELTENSEVSSKRNYLCQCCQERKKWELHSFRGPCSGKNGNRPCITLSGTVSTVLIDPADVTFKLCHRVRVVRFAPLRSADLCSSYVLQLLECLISDIWPSISGDTLAE